ncbi:MAG: TerC/Alx family metal homeostasis membrane protein, partial [Actinomycetota bacterium]
MDLWVWGAFIGFIVAMLAVDLLVVHRDAHAVSVREAAVWSGIWIGLALAFGGVIWLWMGPDAGGRYFAGYLLEKSLSVDNIFVFALIFGAFAVPGRLQHDVLFWGVLGALVLRAIFIATGVTLLDRFEWTFYVFGAFLVITGIRMAVTRDRHVDPGRNLVLRAMRRVVPMTHEYDDRRMVVRRSGRVMATPLLGVLIVVETTDIIFAFDSIPAILAVTTSPFLVFTSNAFAILG